MRYILLVVLAGSALLAGSDLANLPNPAANEQFPPAAASAPVGGAASQNSFYNPEASIIGEPAGGAISALRQAPYRASDFSPLSLLEPPPEVVGLSGGFSRGSGGAPFRGRIPAWPNPYPYGRRAGGIRYSPGSGGRPIAPWVPLPPGASADFIPRSPSFPVSSSSEENKIRLPDAPAPPLPVAAPEPTSGLLALTALTAVAVRHIGRRRNGAHHPA